MQLHNFATTGYLLEYIDPELLTPVWDEIKAKTRFPAEIPVGYNYKFDLTDCKDHLAAVLSHHLAKFNETNPLPDPLDLFGESRPLVLTDLWANYMNRGYYEPIHGHSGVVSFVIWLDVPYTIEDEANARPFYDKRYNTSGCFAFHTTNALGQIQNTILPTDKEFENTLCLFPADMHHSVFPFFSTDKMRLSIAGNFFFETEK